MRDFAEGFGRGLVIASIMVVALCVFLVIALYAMENIGWWTTPVLAILLFAAIGGWANWKAERM